MLLPDVEVTLLEPMARRVSFLAECVTALDLANAAVRRGRAEDLAGQLAADVVVARAVAPLDRLVGLAAGLARPGGLVLAMKGASAAHEVARAQPALRRLGARGVELIQAGTGRVEPTVTVFRFTVPVSPVSQPTGPAEHGRRSKLPGPAGMQSGAAGRRSRMDRPGGRKGG
jgi:16S rRNA (guanine527-N7)-methyltransferase